MKSKLAIPVPEVLPEGPFDPSPIHLPYPQDGNKSGRLAIPISESHWLQSSLESPPRVAKHPLNDTPHKKKPSESALNYRAAHDSASFYLPYAIQCELPEAPHISIPGTRFEEGPWDPPFAPPPYSSMIDDVLSQIAQFKQQDIVRQNALHPVKLKAGQHTPVNGELGRNAVPTGERLSLLGAQRGAHPSNWTIPEAGSGTLVASSI